MDERGEDGGLLRGTSARLLRQGSALLAGGVILEPAEEVAAPSGESRPILRRQASRRVESQEAVVMRFAEETGRRYWAAFFFFAGLLVVTLTIYFVLMIIHVLALSKHHSKPCDQPLKYYLVVFLGVLCLATTVVTPVSQAMFGEMKGAAAGFVFSVSLEWGCIAWGGWMIHECETCQSTNPELYNSARHFIYWQIVGVVVGWVWIGITCTLGLRLCALIETGQNTGCFAAVAKMTRLKLDDPELIDQEDGKVMDCPICQVPLDTTGMSVLRTPCCHHFHVQCFEKWSKSHVDCPLCRAVLDDSAEEALP